MGRSCNSVSGEECSIALGDRTCPCVECDWGSVKVSPGECANIESGTCPLYGCPKHEAILKEENTVE